MTIQEVLFELNSFIDIVDKRKYLEKQLKDIVDELLAADEIDRDVYIDKLTSAFDGTKMKGAIKKFIAAAIANKVKQESKSRIGEFSNVDFDKLIHKNGVIVPTPSNIYEILSAAKTIVLFWDKMTYNVYFEKMSWIPETSSFSIEFFDGSIKHYYKYETDNATMLRIAMNKGPFPTEIDFRGLDKVVEAVAKRNPIDLYQQWGLNCEENVIHDGVNRINDPNTNFAVQYLGCSPGRWSAIWCEKLMLNLVSRLFEPGCHTRYWFFLEGEQNIGKSMFCSMLVPKPFFVSTGLSQAQSNEDNFNRSIHDKGMVELAELGGTHKVENNLVKKIVTDRDTSFRKMRQDPVIGYPKHCIMIVTTNEAKHLRDNTGETRAMPIKSELKTGQLMNLEGFAKVYPQILAQAIKMYRAGVSRYLNDEEQLLQQEQTDTRDTFQEDDVYKIVGDYLYTMEGSVLNIDTAKQDGLYYQLIYDYVRFKYETANPFSIIRFPHKIGQAFEKFGFTRVVKGGKIKTAEGWKSAQKWFWSGKE